MVGKQLAAASDLRCLPLLEIGLFSPYNFDRNRIEAATELGKLTNVPGASIPLIRLLETEFDKYCLGDGHSYSIHDRAPSEGAMFWLELRRTAAEALGRVGGPEAIAVLTKLLPRSAEYDPDRDMDYSFCETTIAALVSILKRRPGRFSESTLRPLVEWPDCTLKVLRERPTGDYFVKGRTDFQMNSAELRAAAKAALGEP